jgi:AraC family transcriptional regulator
VTATPLPIHAWLWPHHITTVPLPDDRLRIVFIRRGRASLSFHDATQQLHPTDVLLLPSGFRSTLHLSSATIATSIDLSRRYVREQESWLYPEDGSRDGCQLRVHPMGLTVHARILQLGDPPNSTMDALLGELVSVSAEPRTCSRFFRAQTIVFSVFDLLTKHCRNVQTLGEPAANRSHQLSINIAGGRCARAVCTVASLLDKEPQHPWTLTELAAVTHLSQSQLGRLFKEAYGLPPIAYLTRLRVSRMRAMLTESDATVASIARSVGWRNADHASRQFSRATGLSPREYRRRSRTRPDGIRREPD